MQRGQFNESPCILKKKLQNPKKKKKIANSIKLDLPSCPLIPLIFIKRYTRSIICDILSKNEQFLNLFVNKLFGGSLKMYTKYCVTSHFSKRCPRELSFHTIPSEIHLVD